MAPGPEDTPSGRELTDESLAEEREKADDEFGKGAVALEEGSDEVVARARGRAARLLEKARSKADEKAAPISPSQRQALTEERESEDLALSEERLVADQSLTSERDTRRRALAALLALEREETDHHLLLERERADLAVRSRDDFLALVTHDVRNLLGGLVMSASSVQDVPCDDVAAKATITREAQRIRRYAARMNRLVGDLLDVVSIQAGRLAVVPQREDATELLRETVDAFQLSASVKNISLRTQVKAGGLLARYDHERVLQVLANLVGNAVKFTPNGGRIDLFVEAIDDQIRFGVRDTGRGIPADRMSVVFERYWQRESVHGGLGLGLYIARCIVEAHGGRIWAESAPGEGSTFYFTLPAAPPQPAPATG